MRNVLSAIIGSLAVIATSACAANTNGVSLMVKDNDPTVVGKWVGMHESRSPGSNTVQWATTVNLDIRDGKAAFQLGSGQKWETAVRFQDGGITLGYHGAFRKFLLQQSKSGRLFLVTNYDMQWQGNPIEISIELEKK